MESTKFVCAINTTGVRELSSEQDSLICCTKKKDDCETQSSEEVLITDFNENLKKSGYIIKSPRCGRDKFGGFHCVCGHCEELVT